MLQPLTSFVFHISFTFTVISPRISVFHNCRHHENIFAPQNIHFSTFIFLNLLHASIIDYNLLKLFEVLFWATNLSPTNLWPQTPTQQSPAPLQLHLPFPSRLQLLLLIEFVSGKMYSDVYIREKVSFVTVENLITNRP